MSFNFNNVSLRKQFVIFALFAVVLLSVFLPTYLSKAPPTRDSGVFLYVGEQILEGKIPYRDVWDHKGPLLYYLNAFGLWLGNGTAVGIWFVEFFWVLAAAIIGFILLREAFGLVPAMLSTIIWLFNSYVLEIGNNLTEAYTLLFQFAALYLFWLSLKSPKPARHCFAIGLIMGAAFLFRANNIGTHLSIVAYLILSGILAKRWRTLASRTAVILSGFFVVMGITAVYFASHHALGELINQMFIYNITYANASTENKLITILVVLIVLISANLTIIVFTAWLLGLRQAIGRQLGQKPWGALVIVALIGLPVETFLAGFSGWVYAHYAMTLLPVIAVLVAFFLSGISSNLRKRFSGWHYGILLAIFIWATYKPILRVAADLMEDQSSLAIALLADVQTAVSEHDYLVMWGAETSFNFVLEKEAPTRFVYQYPLFSADYVTPAMVDEFLAGIVRERPLIIDTSSTNPGVPPLNPGLRADWLASTDRERLLYVTNIDHLQDVFAYIQANYVVTGIAGEEWPIYTYVGD